MDFINDLNTDSTDFLGIKAHEGFHTFFTDVQRALLDYAEQHPAIESGNLKILITGHSLGAAGANLLGAWFNNPRNNWALKNDIFVYTFASPNTYCGNNPDVEECSNIFNIVHEEDPVPKFPFANNLWDQLFNPWRKFGVTKNFNTGEFVLGVLITKAFKFHPPKFYIDAVEHKIVANGNSTGIAAIVACPVDVEVYDKSGVIVGRITNNIVDASVSKILLHVIDDVKYIFLPNENGYSIKLTGTNNGSMAYGVWKYAYASNEPIEQKTFQNVSLSFGKRMTSDVVGGITVPNTRLYVVDNAGTRIAEVQSNGTEIAIIYPQKITISGANTVEYLGSITLTANQSVKWSSTSPYVNVNEITGVVTSRKSFIKTGTATITATNANESATFQVKVTPSFGQWLMIIFLFGWIWM